MIVWGTDDDGGVEAAVFARIADWDGETLTIVRVPPEVSFRIPVDWIARIEPVDSELQETLLQAKYAFSVAIGPLPDDADMGEYKKTGLSWPVNDAE